ncbi:MAG: HD domain-containing protein [Geobacteraceae bacterium]|nr:HD domain-containing protein [Geobacteraceae bacterium]
MNSKLSLSTAQRIASIFSGLIRNTSLYPPGNPALTRPLNELHTLIVDYLAGSPSLRIGLSDEILFLEEHLFVTAPQQVEDLATHFASRKVEAVIIMPDVTADELFQLSKLFADRALSTESLIDHLEDSGITHILVIAQGDNEERLLHEAGNAYQAALDSVRTALIDIEANRIPSSERLLAATRQFSDVAAQDPQIVACLSMIKDYDNYTFNHSVNVGVISLSLAAYMKLDRIKIEEAGMAGFLHDIGKTLVPKTIINKPGKLSSIEFDEIKKHPEDGVKIIKAMHGLSGNIAEAVLGHHLRYNRKGYPEWAKDMELSNLSQIVAIADCFDACTTLRVYQLPMPPAQAIKVMKRLAGEFLNPEMVENFASMMGKYPPGTLIRLDTNEIALVWKGNLGNPETPKVRIVFDRFGNKVEKPVTEKLEERRGGAPAIVAIIDPITKGIDVGDYFKQG